MAIAIIGTSWLAISAALACGISKAIAIADQKELGGDSGR